MTYRTMTEWNNKDRYVKKGEKSGVRCPETKQPLFHKKQTKKSERTFGHSEDGGYYEETEYPDWDDWDTVICSEGN